MIEPQGQTAEALRPTLVPAHVSAEKKREILRYVWQEAGPLFLLSIGQGVSEAIYDPIWRGALRSKSPEYLFEKWRRFEKFSHSFNRLRIDPVNQTKAEFQRHTIDGGVPTLPENLFICGLMIALLEKIGCLELSCEMPLQDGTPFLLRANGKFRLPPDAESLNSALWKIEWQNFSPRLMAQDIEASTLPAVPNIPNINETIERLLRLLMMDVSQQWKIDELAREAGMSKRSLQRKLTDVGLSFSNLVRLVRIQEACTLLEKSDVAVTSVAFGTGFSDRAHFSRDFRSSMGMTPTDYRVGLR